MPTSNERSEDFETFLRMLTTQIQNQDPLSPLKAEEFASQLATFSMVEQQTLTNENLENLTTELTNDWLASSAVLLGRDVAYSGSFNFGGDPVQLEFGTPIEASDVSLVVRDVEGQIVDIRTVARGSVTAVWDGVASDTQTALPGSYSAELRNLAEDELVEVPIYTHALVEEVRFGNGQPEFLLDNGSVILGGDVAILR